MVPYQVRLGTGLTRCDVVGKSRVQVFEEEEVEFCHHCTSRGISGQGLFHLLCHVSRMDYG